MKVLFSINEYDRDGDIVDNCVFLHLEDKGIRIKFQNSKELENFSIDIKNMIPEIKETEKNS